MSKLKLFSDRIFGNFSQLWEGIVTILGKARYRRLVFLAILANIFTFLFLIFLLWIGFWFLSQWGIEGVVGWDLITSVEIGFGILFVILAIFLSVVIFPGVSSIVNSLVYMNLTDKIMAEVSISTQTEDDENKFTATISVIFTAIAFEIKKILVTVFLLGPLLCVVWIPVAGQLLFGAGLIVNSILLNGSDLFEPVFSSQNKRYRSLLKFIVTTPSSWLFLFTIATVNAIPLLNIVTLPITTSAAIFLFKPDYSHRYKI